MGDTGCTIEDFPPEILGHIFEMWMQTCEPFVPPFELGEVCSLWRTVAWATPTLWTHVPIDISFDWGEYPSSRAREFDETVRRSGNLPLSLYVRTYKHCEHELDDEIIENIRKCSSRVHQLDLSRVDTVCLEKFFGTLRKDDLRNLRTLRLPVFERPTEMGFVFHDLAEDQILSTNTDIASVAPNLEELDAGSYWDFSKVTLHWHHLRALVIDSSMEELPSFIQSATSLRRLTIANAHYGDAYAPGLVINNHSSDLHVEDVHTQDSVFHFATFSNLRRVSFHRGYLCTKSIVSFLVRSHAARSITTLTLRGVRLTDGDLRDILPHLSSLLHLEISRVACDTIQVSSWESILDAAFCCNTNPSPPGPILPNLRVFRLETFFYYVDDFALLRNIADYVREWEIPLSVFQLSLNVKGLRLKRGQGVSMSNRTSRSIRSFRDEGRSVEVTLRVGDVQHDLTAGPYFPEGSMSGDVSLPVAED